MFNKEYKTFKPVNQDNTIATNEEVEKITIEINQKYSKCFEMLAKGEEECCDYDCEASHD